MPGSLALAAAIALFGLTNSPAATSAPREEAPPEAKPVLGPGRAVWSGTFAEARDRAEKENKVVYVEFVKDSCGECLRMEHVLYPATEFELTLLRMAPVRLDFGKGEAAALASRYHVEDAPAILVVSPGGALIFRLDGYDSQASFFAHLHTSMADYDRLRLQMLNEAQIQDDPDKELALGADLYRRFDSREALPRLQRAASSPRAGEETRENALAYLASAQLELGQVADALATVERILSITRDPVRREKAELFRAQVSLAEGDRADARRRYEEFVKQHPESRLRKEAEAILKGLGPS